MEMEDPKNSTSAPILEELDVGALLLTLEKGLKAPRWRERVQAAHSAASTLVKDGCLRYVSPKDDTNVGASHDFNVYNKLLRQLLHGLALKDSNWQVRVAAVESATTIVAAAKTVLPVDRFAEYVWVVLAVCLDVQPEVQDTAANCTLKRLFVPSSHESHGVVVQLCDRFVEAAIGADSFPLKKSAKISGNSDVTGLDNLPNGEILLAGMIAAICLQLLPSPAAAAAATDGARERQDKLEPDRLPLLLVAVARALVDANKRQSRMIAGGLSRLLRSLGKPFYRQALVAMFNVKSRVYLSGPGLAGTYEHAGIINEDTANVVKSIATVTILEALAFAFEGPHANESWADVFISNTGFEDESRSKSGLSKGELIALQQIIQMLQVPEDLTRTLKGQDMEAKAFEFTKSAVPLLSISTSIIKSGNGVAQDQFFPGKLVEDILLCCATFAGSGGEYGGTAMWTSKDLGELSMKWLKSLPDVLSQPVEATTVSNPGGLKDSADTSIERLIVGQISSLMPKIKQIIQESSGSPGADEVLLKLSPEGTLGASIVAAHQMQWILSQLEHPNLGPHCQSVMPCVLTALDHFSPEVKRQAMRSCIHLARNMNATELRWYKDVTLDAVARSLIGSEELWPVAVKMAVTTVSRIEGSNPRSAWCGRIFSEMLEELARQRDDQNRRVVWLQEIPPQMELMGLVLVAHFKRLLPLLFYWLHAPDDLTRILTLNRLQTLITYTWPRIPAHVKRIWKEIMHTYQNSRNRMASSDIQTAVCQVCKLLNSCAGPTFEAAWQQDEGDEAIGDLISTIKQMKTETIA